MVSLKKIGIFLYSFLMIAAVKSEVVEDPVCNVWLDVCSESLNNYIPPISAVLTLPSLITLKVALAMLFARWSRLG